MKTGPAFRTLACLLFSAFLLFPAASQAREVIVTDITVQQADSLIKKDGDKLLILDVRTPEEFTNGHLPNAINMNFKDASFTNELAKLPLDKEILVYCQSGKRSAGAVKAMREKGFSHITHMNEGFRGWKKAGLPFIKESSS